MFKPSTMSAHVDLAVEPIGIIKTDVTQFVNESSSAAPFNFTPRHLLEPGGDVESRDHTIATVLGRTVQIANVPWTSGRSEGDVLTTAVLPEAYFAAHPNALTKISGFGFFRGGTRIQIQVNCPNTAYGKILLAAIPQIGFMPASADRTLSWWSAFPCVEVNIGTGSTGELTIPYLNYRQWSDLEALFVNGFLDPTTLALFDYAQIALIVVAPLDVTTASVNVSLMANLTDIQVKQSIPPLAPPVPGPLFFLRSGLRDPYVRLSDVQKKNRKMRDQSSESKGFMHSVSTVAGTARDVAGAAKGVGKTAAALSGMGIEPCVLPTMPTLNAGHLRAFPHTTGPSTATALAQTQDARALAPEMLFGTGDEMSISRYAQRPALYDGFPWERTDPPGKILYAAEVSPATLHRALPDGALGTPRRFVTTPLSFTALQFRWYRGGIVFSFSGVKNPFFSGRVRVCYFPKDVVARAGPLTDEEMASVDSTVVDVRTLAELQYTAPYVNNAPWSAVVATDLGGSDASVSVNPRPLGYVYVVVQNELTVADVMATPQCWFDVQKFGAPDIEFAGIVVGAIPCYAGQETDLMTRSVATWEAPGPHKVRAKHAQAASSGAYDDPSTVVSVASAVAPPKMPLDLLCMSERIDSWREFAHRWTRLNPELTGGNNQQIRVADLENHPYTTLGVARSIFAYYTGSVEFMAIGSSGTNVSEIALSPGDDSLALLEIYAPYARTFMRNDGAFGSDAAVRIPWQEVYPFLPMALGAAPVANYPAPSPRSGCLSFTNPQFNIFIRGGDDCHFGVPIAPPPVALCTFQSDVPDERYQVHPFT